jgi:hypothetical protein
MYRDGRGVTPDYQEAARWFRKAIVHGNRFAREQLADMYRSGELQQPKQLTDADRARARTLRHLTLQALVVLLIAVLLLFTFGLLTLQNGTLTGWKRAATVVFVHCVGIVLVLNTLNTYTLELFLSKCGSAWLNVHCVAPNPRFQGLVDWLTAWQMINLIARFMVIIGLLLDVLSGWYVWYLLRPLFKRGDTGRHAQTARPSKPLTRAPSAP